MNKKHKRKLMKAKLITICTKDKLKEIRAFVAKQIEKLELDEKTRHHIVLAIDEAAANAIIHGNQCDANKTIQVEVKINDEKLSVEISDIGKHPLAVKEHTDRQIHEIVREKRKGGMGLKLMHHIMDEVAYFRKGQKSFCSMTKMLKTSS